MRIDRVRVIDGGAGATLVEVGADGATGIGLTQSAYEYVEPIIEKGPVPARADASWAATRASRAACGGRCSRASAPRRAAAPKADSR